MGFLSCFLILLLRLGNKKQIPAGASHAPQWLKGCEPGLTTSRCSRSHFPLSSVCWRTHPPPGLAPSPSLDPTFSLAPASPPGCLLRGTPQDCGSQAFQPGGLAPSWFPEPPFQQDSPCVAGLMLPICIQILMLPTSSTSFPEPELELLGWR